MTTCDYDTGTMYGCRPLCDQPATTAVTYRNGSLPAFTSTVCDRHVKATEGRVFPGLISVERIGR